MNSERVWLVKHPDLSFSRPITENELLDKIKTGELKPRDEICAGNGYWFSLQDIKEVRKHFGELSLSGMFQPSEEDTQKRYAVTAPIQTATLAQSSKPAMKPMPPPAPSEIKTDQKNPVVMKLLWVILIAALLLRIYTWFA